MVGLKAALAAAAQGPGPAGPLLEVLVEALPLGVLLQDTDRRVVLVNSAFIRLAGISARPAELVGVTFDGSARHVLDLFEVGRREPPPGEQAAPGRTIERECVPLEAGGELLGQLWVLRDVTDQAAARRTAIEQDRLAAELAVLRSDFVATVSHELRTPLTSIVGLSTLLLDGAGRLDPEQTECLQAIERSADRLLRLADDLTLLAGLESQRVPLRAEPVDAIALIRRRAPVWQESAAAAGIDLQLDHPDAGPPLPGDERLLTRMLDNLVAAAVAASAPGCQVRLSVRPAAGDWIIEIADPTLAAEGGETPGGPAAAGVPAAPGQSNPPDERSGPGQRDQPSQPGDASRHGAGLGPIISQAIAKRHQGSLDVRSATNAWTIRVQLPAADAGLQPPAY
jgi:signal transduction histidine kinase